MSANDAPAPDSVAIDAEPTGHPHTSPGTNSSRDSRQTASYASMRRTMGRLS